MKRDASEDEPDEYSTDEGEEEEEDGEEEEEGSEDGEGISSSFGLSDIKLLNTLKGSKKNISCE